MVEKKLIRPQKGRILFGVCRGLADYFNIDPAIVRLIFVLLALFGGSGFILYIIGIFVIPPEQTKDVQDKEKPNAVSEIKETFNKHLGPSSGEQTFGLILIVLGLLFLFNILFPWFSIRAFWPLILIIIGLILLVSTSRRKQE